MNSQDSDEEKRKHFQNPLPDITGIYSVRKNPQAQHKRMQSSSNKQKLQTVHTRLCVAHEYTDIQ